MEVRCYVLLDDGSLEVWSREDNASIGIGILLFVAPVFALIGILIGIIIGILLYRFGIQGKVEANER
jgi:hypothetical protein